MDAAHLYGFKALALPSFKAHKSVCGNKGLAVLITADTELHVWKCTNNGHIHSVVVISPVIYLIVYIAPPQMYKLARQTNWGKLKQMLQRIGEVFLRSEIMAEILSSELLGWKT